MVTFSVFSDLHLEHDPSFRPNTDADILILAGDICVVEYFNRGENSPYFIKWNQFLDFFEHCSKMYKHVLYVPGNHEHYHGRFDNTVPHLRAVLEQFSNIQVLNNEIFQYEDVTFIGSTLWTDLNKQSPSCAWTLQQSMNDYHVVTKVENGLYRKLNPSDTLKEHFIARDFISTQAGLAGKVVVITHHQPSYLSVHPRYVNAVDLNGGYCSDLSEVMLDNSNIKYWVAGHCHDNFDYVIGETNVIVNPKGYHDENPAFKEQLILEV